MNIDIKEISKLIDKVKEFCPVHFNIAAQVQCELSISNGLLQVMLCFQGRVVDSGKFSKIMKNRHVFPDQYGAIKIGLDRNCNFYAGKEIKGRSAHHIVREISTINELVSLNRSA